MLLDAQSEHVAPRKAKTAAQKALCIRRKGIKIGSCVKMCTTKSKVGNEV
jgi:hypothetical protein